METINKLIALFWQFELFEHRNFTKMTIPIRFRHAG